MAVATNSNTISRDRIENELLFISYHAYFSVRGALPGIAVGLAYSSISGSHGCR